MEDMVSNLQLLQSTYTGKKVFLTGHTGFKGAWMLAWLTQLGAKVKGYSLAPEQAEGAFSTLPTELSFESKLADIRDKQKLTAEIQNFQPDFIFHLAAQPLVRYSYQYPAETFDVNVTGTANLLEAAATLNSGCSIVVITTDKVYHNNEWNYPYRENDILGGYDPYSASKACAELVVNSFRQSFFNPKNYSQHKKGLASARAGNVIGGGDWSADRIIPDIVRSLSKNEVVSVRNPQSVRPWQHVLEPIEGYLLLGIKLHQSPTFFNKAYNFGPLASQHVPVSKLVEQCITTWGNGKWKDMSDGQAPHEAGLLTLDINLAKAELEWEPKLSCDEAINWTLKWYKNYFETKKSIMLEQISAFEKII